MVEPVDWGWVVTSEGVERFRSWKSSEHVSVEELARQQGVRSIASVDELVRPETFESDDELDEFLADLNGSRRAGAA